MLDLTPLARPFFRRRVTAARSWQGRIADTQRDVLARLLQTARRTRVGQRHDFASIKDYETFAARVPVISYEDIRADVMEMVNGSRDILWPGRCTHFAQSSGTSGGKSKYIPVTADSLKLNHYAGGRDVVAHYLSLNPDSRIFSGKSFILGGSYANELGTLPAGTVVGDLSANLIDNINPAVNLLRVPSKKIALMADWHQKLPALVETASRENITNISGVPSWFMTVIRETIKACGATTIHDVWPNLEVFFHGGIAFGPYRSQYRTLTDPSKMHYLETYNASEGFFAVQTSWDDEPGVMQLLLDIGVFYEFQPVGTDSQPVGDPVPAWKVEEGKTYALVITACNGLWRYSIGDTVTVKSADPLKIRIAGRTKSFINAFGEELMVCNADEAIAEACRRTGAGVANYTAAPVYDDGGHRGHHQWLIEWSRPPADTEAFADILDRALQSVNSDYQAKRSGDIFLDRLSLVTAQTGLFDRWLAETGKLGGQRKVPRLCNDRKIIDRLLEMNF